MSTYQESLKMLESEEGQLNAVYACYGSAAQHGQLFEAALRDILVTHQSLVKRLPESSLTKKKTMGQLLTEFRKYIKIRNENDQWVFDSLSSALEMRNFLIHRYFLDRQDNFGTGSGRFDMLVELTSIQNKLDAARVLTNAIRIALCEKWEGRETDQDSRQAVFSVQVSIPESVREHLPLD